MAKVVIQGDSTKPKPEGSGNLVPQGTYELQCTEVHDQPAKDSTKYPSSRVVLKVVESHDGRHVGRINSHFLSHSPKAASMVREFLENALVPFNEVQVPGPQGPVTGVEFDTDDIVGKYVRGRCYHDSSFDGKPREKWTDWEVSKYAVQQGVPQQPQQQVPQAPPQVAHQAGQGQAPPRAMPPQQMPQQAPPQAAPQQPAPQQAPPQAAPQAAPQQPVQPQQVHYPQGNPNQG